MIDGETKISDVINERMEHDLKTKQHAIITDDSRLNYMVVPTPPPEELEPLPTENGETGIGLASNVHMVPLEKYDFYIPLSDEDKSNTKHIEPLRYSFLQIKEGEIDKGIDWYKRYYPKVPDELIEIMARYNFGDLKYATRKSIRNDSKKYVKKHKSKPEINKGLIVKNRKSIVSFD